MKPSELLSILQDLYRERLALRMRHVAGAEVVSHYEFNNTYQYIIAREDTHLEWIRSAIRDLGGEVPSRFDTIPLPQGGPGGDRASAVMADDQRLAQVFVDRWRSRAESLTNARHKNMLRIMLGEVLEHKRFFDQMMAGREDLLGRRPEGASTGGGVLPTRWVE